VISELPQRTTDNDNDDLVPAAPRQRQTWRLCCMLCGRTRELVAMPARRRCEACGGYLEARRTREWEAC
jgi:rRNA maturation endonuclease Nob1